MMFNNNCIVYDTKMAGSVQWQPALLVRTLFMLQNYSQKGFIEGCILKQSN